ncbi:MAG: GntR family transcriptional regulator, partial [Clostridium sp.]
MENPEDSLLGGGYIHTNTYKEQAYKLIKDAVLYNRFRVGAVYSQEAICNELGLSRTPVREALLELQNEG